MSLLGSVVGAVAGALGLGGSSGGGAQTVTDKGYIRASELARDAMTTVAMISTGAATYIATRQLAIAEKYYDLAKEMRDYWNSTYKPLEVKIVQEASSEPIYTPQYEVVGGRFLANVKHQFKRSIDTIGTKASRYCTGLTSAQMRDLAVAQAMAEGDAVNLAYRYEDGRKQIFDERRWSRRHQVAALGRDMLAQADSYMGKAHAAYEAPRDFATGVANTMLGSLRYDDMMAARFGQHQSKSTQNDASYTVLKSVSLNNGATTAGQNTPFSFGNYLNRDEAARQVTNLTTPNSVFNPSIGPMTTPQVASTSIAPGRPGGSSGFDPFISGDR
ncbi:hypothetical protein V757_02205 [Pelistega indica]|uniref:Uncharacterized protein n=1 Tax=Pelistega indica TaxID=1414851 RepID=V8G9Z7_9BURK|nr:hypothetical protein [Pelistega indica]ETD72773.1 hypothetical protein V757_02205 [Pelistega indica]